MKSRRRIAYPKMPASTNTFPSPPVSTADVADGVLKDAHVATQLVDLMSAFVASRRGSRTVWRARSPRYWLDCQ
jgi:hypothetical protein